MNEDHLSVPKILLHLQNKDDTHESDFLKEDLYSTPMFRHDPQRAQETMQVRFHNENEKAHHQHQNSQETDVGKEIKVPIKRSVLGSTNDFMQFKQAVKEKREKMAQDQLNQNLVRKRTLGSKIVQLRNHLTPKF